MSKNNKGKSKKKSQVVDEIKSLFSNPEFVEAEITDAQDYIHESLTLNELQEYKTYYNEHLKPLFIRFKKLRDQASPEAWAVYKTGLFGPFIGHKHLKELQKELKKVWKKRPQIESRVVEEGAVTKEINKNKEKTTEPPINQNKEEE